ncbi:uncharacterized protein LOC119983412 [Tripterygium wilfordii]|uniref:uncharacterized protein LOC119983412 n=1 Tax=Tripterygium wilfordii TaxID=458696 RepID=UPI0018F8481C|nr:uncharacterized protein LOC119983412 [Tripterygium wilfordii]
MSITFMLGGSWRESVSGPEFVKDAKLKVEEIKKRLLIAQSREKSYADRRRPLEFSVGDKVFVKRVGEVAYRLALPPKLSNVHNVFHVSTLRKYEPDPSHVLDWETLTVEDDRTYFVQPVRILDRQDKVTRTHW